MRRTFIHAVRTIVALRCKAPGYAPLSKEAYRKERDRLIRIGRAASRAARRASFVIDDEELRTLRARISSAVDEEYKRTVESRLSDGGGSKGDEDGGKGGGGGGASAATVARLEGDVQSLRDELASTRSELQAGIDGLGGQMRELLCAVLGERDHRVRPEA